MLMEDICRLKNCCCPEGLAKEILYKTVRTMSFSFIFHQEPAHSHFHDSISFLFIYRLQCTKTKQKKQHTQENNNRPEYSSYKIYWK